MISVACNANLITRSKQGLLLQVCSWWGVMFSVVAHWLLGEDEQADALYPTLENVPEPLKASEDPLPFAVLNAVRYGCFHPCCNENFLCEYHLTPVENA